MTKAATLVAAAEPKVQRCFTRGRPRDEGKRAAILDAARAQFIWQGVCLTTMEEVARQAGVSKVTVYNRFGDKDGLFRAVVRQELTILAGRCMLPINSVGGFRERLYECGLAAARMMLDADYLLFDRLIMLEAERFPDCARAYFDAGLGRLRSQLSALLSEGDRARLLVVPDPDRAAEHLILLCQGFLPQEVRLGVCQAPENKELERRVRLAADVFLNTLCVPR